jgi:FHS family glucose/mannose:H+ symporter-like MFS transporter
MSGSFSAAGRSRPVVAAVYAGFLLTGALTVLLGSLLPRVTALYGLTDSEAGALLTIQFATSACGALFVRRHFAITMMRGYGLICAAAALLLTPWAVPAAVGIGLFGLGLGMAMTSTSMLVGQLYPESRGAALSTLNSCWSAGAMLCPLAIAAGVGRWPQRDICLPIVGLCAVFAAVPLLGHFPVPHQDQAVDVSGRKPGLRTLIGFALAAFLYVGVEAGAGGWMSTYASRAVAWDFVRSSLATAIFWGALLASRLAAPLILRRVSEARCLLLTVTAAAAGLAILIAAHQAWLLLLSAAWIGFALGPIFPLIIAFTIDRIGATGNAGWVFALAGFGGAVLPWITGLISSGTHSLRLGLLALLIADLFMLATAARMVGQRRPVTMEPARADA